jgi:hypothetical protein
MGIGSSLLQFVESLRENRTPGPDDARPSSVRPEGPARTSDPLAEVAREAWAARQRLEALADRLTVLKAKAGIDVGASGGLGTPRPSTK